MGQSARQVSVTVGSSALLWQASTGIAGEEAAINLANGIFRAADANNPVPIVIVNLDAANPVYLGPATVTSGTGARLASGGALTRNVIGGDSEYAIATGGTVIVSVEIGKQ